MLRHDIKVNPDNLRKLYAFKLETSETQHTRAY